MYLVSTVEREGYHYRAIYMIAKVGNSRRLGQCNGRSVWVGAMWGIFHSQSAHTGTNRRDRREK